MEETEQIEAIEQLGECLMCDHLSGELTAEQLQKLAADVKKSNSEIPDYESEIL